MSNKKHKKCEIRRMANEAKDRLSKNNYKANLPLLTPPKNISPSQKEIFIKLCGFVENGKTLDNPIKQLADENKLATLSHEERQRYILQLSADYVSMKRAIDEKLEATKNGKKIAE
ncbi:MAG: hypothetical protein RSB59_01375 [Clostridia bacterium]